MTDASLSRDSFRGRIRAHYTEIVSGLRGLRFLRVELWTREDVGGHALGCRMLPTQHGDHGPDQVACDCYASVWRRRL